MSHILKCTSAAMIALVILFAARASALVIGIMLTVVSFTLLISTPPGEPISLVEIA